MPVYDYLCPECGPFTDMRPMAECDLPSRCEGCGFDAPRAFFDAPYFACMPVGQRKAQAVNERSRHAPKTLGSTSTRPRTAPAAIAARQSHRAALRQPAAAQRAFQPRDRG